MIKSRKHIVSTWKRPILLASSSPRRAQLLTEYGVEALLAPPTIDDGEFICGSIGVKEWVQTLAVLKAKNVQETRKEKIGTIIAADTVCVVDAEILGQPSDVREAEQMIQSMTNRSHKVFTGWCLLCLERLRLQVSVEVATITIGTISVDEIKRYIESGLWRGKAGGYNLSERITSGWPIVCDGDPTAVMGLPMVRLSKELEIK